MSYWVILLVGNLKNFSFPPLQTNFVTLTVAWNTPLEEQLQSPVSPAPSPAGPSPTLCFWLCQPQVSKPHAHLWRHSSRDTNIVLITSLAGARKSFAVVNKNHTQLKPLESLTQTRVVGHLHYGLCHRACKVLWQIPPISGQENGSFSGCISSSMVVR